MQDCKLCMYCMYCLCTPYCIPHNYYLPSRPAALINQSLLPIRRLQAQLCDRACQQLACVCWTTFLLRPPLPRSSPNSNSSEPASHTAQGAFPRFAVRHSYLPLPSLPYPTYRYLTKPCDSLSLLLLSAQPFPRLRTPETLHHTTPLFPFPLFLCAAHTH